VFSNNLTTSTPGRATISYSQLDAGFQLTSPLTIKGQDANTTYTIGNVSITNNNPAVTAVSSTFWLTQLFVGQTIQFASQPATNYTILTINSNTSITLTGNYTGTTSANTILTAITPNGTTSAGGPVFIQGGAASNNGTIGVRGGMRAQLGGDATQTILETAEVSVGQRVVALNQIGSGITATQIPANTGDGIIWIGNSPVIPTTGKPVGGGILYVSNSAANWKDGYGTSIALSPSSNGTINTQLGRISDYISYGTVTTSGGTVILTVPLPTSISTAKISVDILAKITAASTNTGTAVVGDMYGETV